MEEKAETDEKKLKEIKKKCERKKSERKSRKKCNERGMEGYAGKGCNEKRMEEKSEKDVTNEEKGWQEISVKGMQKNMKELRIGRKWRKGGNETRM